MILIGFNATIIVRVANKLGACNVNVEKFLVVVVSIKIVSIGVVCVVVVLATNDYDSHVCDAYGGIIGVVSSLYLKGSGGGGNGVISPVMKLLLAVTSKNNNAAQDISVNFMDLYYYNGNMLPFAAEIEHFVDSDNMSHPTFSPIFELEFLLFSREDQMSGKKSRGIAIGEVISKSIANNGTLGYLIGRVYLFLSSLRIDEDHIQFRQCLAKEMAMGETEAVERLDPYILFFDKAEGFLDVQFQAANLLQMESNAILVLNPRITIGEGTYCNAATDQIQQPPIENEIWVILADRS